MESFKNVLFPTDFSKSADNALQHALRMADVQQGEVIVQHVVSTYFEKHSHWATLFDIHEMQKYMDMYVETEMARITPKETEGNISFRNVISEGKPAQEIVNLAEKEQADLVVMGPAKGAVTGAVIRATTRPVLAVAQSSDGDRGLRKVSKLLVGTDFSAHSKKVVSYAFELKQFFGCDLYLLHAIELTRAIRFGISQQYFKDAVSKARTYAENQLKNMTPDSSVGDSSVHYVIEEGTAHDCLVAAAENYDIDMVVLGAHGYGPVQKHFVGTTTDKIMSSLNRPILTVKI
jgi:nucleotide-binding universal stress UspA family protein